MKRAVECESEQMERTTLGEVCLSSVLLAPSSVSQFCKVKYFIARSTVSVAPRYVCRYFRR